MFRRRRLSKSRREYELERAPEFLFDPRSDPLVNETRALWVRPQFAARDHSGGQLREIGPKPFQPVLRFGGRPLERRGERRTSLRPPAASSCFSAFEIFFTS